jgi:hypothetical protein
MTKPMPAAKKGTYLMSESLKARRRAERAPIRATKKTANAVISVTTTLNAKKTNKLREIAEDYIDWYGGDPGKLAVRIAVLEYHLSKLPKQFQIANRVRK